MRNASDVLGSLEQFRQELQTVYKVKEIGVFGSFVRGEQRDDSDIDVLVDLSEDADLLDLIGLGQFLESQLHHRVDVVLKAAVRMEIREQVLREARYL